MSKTQRKAGTVVALTALPALYPDQHVVVLGTKFDKFGRVRAGVVLAHHEQEAEMFAQYERIETPPQSHIAFVYTGEEPDVLICT